MERKKGILNKNVMNRSKNKLLLLLVIFVIPLSISAQASGEQIRRSSKKVLQHSSQNGNAKQKKSSSSNLNVINNSNPTGCINGHAYIDLGLPSGTKWATCNVGAKSPEEYGYYFAWGEIESKNEYDAYKTPLYRVAIDDISNNENYDVATIKWGNDWSIPTKYQWDELIRYCRLKVTKKNGINGILFIGGNRKSVFFPAGGRKLDTLLQFDGSCGYYWSSNADYTYQGNPAYAPDGYSTECIISCTTSITNSNPIAFFDPEWRGYGLNIRPVTK